MTLHAANKGHKAAITLITMCQQLASETES